MVIMAQACGIGILTVLLVLYLRYKRLELHTLKAYLWIWTASMVNLVIDITSAFMNLYMEYFDKWLVNVVNKVYLVSLVCLTTVALLYVVYDGYAQAEEYRTKRRIVLAICIVGSVIIFLSPIEVVSTARHTVYTRGISVVGTYGICLLEILWTIAVTTSAKRRMNTERRRAVLTWLVLWLFAMALQFITGELMVAGFCGALGVMVIYLRLENPEMYIDRATGFFNQVAFDEYTKQLFNDGTDFSVICMKFPYDLYSGNNRIEHDIQVEVVNYCKGIQGVGVFQNDFDELFLLIQDEEYAKKLMNMLLERFSLPWGKRNDYILDLNWLFMPPDIVKGQAGNILYVIRDILNSSTYFSDTNFLTADGAIITEINLEQKYERMLSDAIDKDRIEVYFQPIYSMEHKRFTAAEALVRIRDENGELVPPVDFIEVAEKKGLILHLGKRVFEKVCKYIQKQDMEKLGLEYIEVNISAVQFGYEKLAEDFKKCMMQYDIKPTRINLEITESASFSTKKQLAKTLNELMEYGVKFSLDDFGTGHSNLNYIIEMPVDIIKFDKGMTSAYFRDGKARYVMDAAMQMIKGMQLKIVAEGIETREQFETMERLGIDYIQGYYFSKPLSETDFTEFIQKHNVHA